MSVPLELLLSFFRRATDALQDCEPLETSEPRLPAPLSHHRYRILEVQQESLQRVVREYNEKAESGPITTQMVQESLAKLGKADTRSDDDDDGYKLLQEAMHALNDTARLTFSRHVLYEECMYERLMGTSASPERSLETRNGLARATLLEYAALCNAAVRLPCVQRHLRDGSPLFEDIGDASASQDLVPRQRLEHIERLLMCAIGYDPEHGSRELERLIVDSQEMRRVIEKLSSNMHVASTNATLSSREQLLSDQNAGGFTRVVSVSYSEKVVDGDTGREISSTGAPKAETIQEQKEIDQRTQLNMARQAEELRQSLLQEFLALSGEERDRQLLEAEAAHNDFVHRASQIATGPDRVAFLTGIDPQTQRLLAMRKLWRAVLEENGGSPPTLRR